MASKITALTHEFGDDTVELGACVTEAVLTCAEFTEIPGGF